MDQALNKERIEEAKAWSAEGHGSSDQAAFERESRVRETVGALCQAVGGDGIDEITRAELQEQREYFDREHERFRKESGELLERREKELREQLEAKNQEIERFKTRLQAMEQELARVRSAAEKK